MALQDNDGGGSSSGDLESLRGKPSMFFFFGVKDQTFHRKLPNFIYRNTVSVTNVASKSSELANWKRK